MIQQLQLAGKLQRPALYTSSRVITHSVQITPASSLTTYLCLLVKNIPKLAWCHRLILQKRNNGSQTIQLYRLSAKQLVAKIPTYADSRQKQKPQLLQSFLKPIF